MDYNYKVFNPQASRVAQELLSTPDKELIKKYIKKKNKDSLKFLESVRKEVNEIDDEEYLINPFMYQIAGKNLNHIATQVHVQASKLNRLGYEFRLDAIVRDLDRLLSEKAEEVDKINPSSGIQPISIDIAHFFTTEILAKKVLHTLENNLNKKSGLTIN